MPFSASFPLLSSGAGIYTLEDLFKQLSYGELSNLAVALDASGTIKKERQNQIVHFANEALKRLHTRLPLKEDTVEITLEDVELDYEFDDDVLHVVSIVSYYGEVVPFETNKLPYQRVYVTGTPPVLHFPEGYNGAVQVTFRQRHAVLDPITNAADLAQEIEIPLEFQPALTAYIASKVYGGMNSQDAVIMASSYRAQYEQVILENMHLLPGEILPNPKLETRGFV